MFSLAGVTEEGGKWQEVGWAQAVWGISIQLCVYVYVCVCVLRTCTYVHTYIR